MFLGLKVFSTVNWMYKFTMYNTFGESINMLYNDVNAVFPNLLQWGSEIWTF